MGWAKYYEDNISICIGRAAVKESVTEKHTPVKSFSVIEQKREIKIQPIGEKKVDKVKYPMRNARRGLELYFASFPEERVCRKLQLNGWWWSASNQCWCNLNNKVNRKYAEDTARRYRAEIAVVAA